MAGIEDFFKVYRGESININPFKKKPDLSPFGKSMEGRYSTTTPKEAIRYAVNEGFPNKVMTTTISPREAKVGARMFDEIVPEFKDGEMKPVKLKGTRLTNQLLKGPLKYVEENGYNILNKKNKNLLKMDILKTIASNAKALTPLAMKGLNILASLPVAAATMVLQSTPANADEANMTLEDFAMMANKEKEGIETIDIGDM